MRNRSQSPPIRNRSCANFGRLPVPDQRRARHQERRRHLRVAVLPRVHVEHELDERAREPGTRAEQHRKARAGHPRGALEVEDAERRAQIPVRLRREIEGPRGATSTDLDVVPGAGSDRHALVRHVRQPQQQVRSLGSHDGELGVETLDLLGPPLVGLEQRRRVLAGPLRFRDRLSRLVALELQRFQPRQQPPPHRIELGQPRQSGFETRAARAQARAHGLEIVAQQGRINHGHALYLARGLPP